MVSRMIFCQCADCKSFTLQITWKCQETIKSLHKQVFERVVSVVLVNLKNNTITIFTIQNKDGSNLQIVCTESAFTHVTESVI